MKKLCYEKPEITIVELNEEIILASGPCIDVHPCLDHGCNPIGCADDDAPPVCLQPDCGFDL